MAASLSAQARPVSLRTVRRLALARQRLCGPPPSPDASGIMETVRDLGCLQIDPTNVVARTQYLVLFSRLGPFQTVELDRLAYVERRLFEYWAHQASLVLSEDYPIHSWYMRTAGFGKSLWDQSVERWLTANKELRLHILSELGARGPLLAREIEDRTQLTWDSTGWSAGRNVSRMLDFLSVKGEALVSRRTGGRKLWDLGERCLPEDLPSELLGEGEMVRAAAQKALRALGVARESHIRQHFTRGRYPNLRAALAGLASEGTILPVELTDDPSSRPGQWWLHSEDLDLLERLEGGQWEPRATLLSPFDNLICDRARTELLFGFHFRIEIYVPKAKRLYGYFSMPILIGERLIGRLDPVLDRKTGRLTINSVHVERDVRVTKTGGRAVARAVEQLASFIGARAIEYRNVPVQWKGILA